jgi:transcriptional regulator with XRE-family HTH domain
VTRLRRRKEPWDRQVKRIEAQFPSVRPDFDWYEALESPELLGKFLHDLANIGWEKPVRRGQRARLARDEGLVRIAALFEGGASLSGLHAESAGEASMESFVDAFTELVAERGHSLSRIAELTGISRSEIHRLQRGERAPTGYDMECIARAYGKEPTFFVEYRVGLLTMALLERLQAAPELTVHALRQLEGRPG